MPTATPFNNLITFSRGSNATVTGSNGLIQWAPNNLLTFSEQFDNAAWTKSNVTVTANNAAAPDGTTTAELVTPTAADCNIRQSFTPAGAVQYTFSVWLRSATGSDISTSIRAWRDSPFQSAGIATITVTPTWQRFTLTFTALDATSHFVVVGAGSTLSTGENLFIWGAQLELGSAATTYNPTTVKNLLGFSEAFDNAAWTKAQASIVTGAQANPVNGLFNAQKLMENTATAEHRVAPVTANITVGTRATISVHVKAAERNKVRIYNAAMNNLVVFFDLTNGVSTYSAGGTAPQHGTVALGNGWYRCYITDTTGGTNQDFSLSLVNTGTTVSYTGDGNSGVYIYGAQLSDSASLDPYVPTPGAAPSSTAFYGPRFDFDPVTLQPRGLLVEEQRTNLLTYSDQLNDGVWTKSQTTVTANSTTSPDGTANADTLSATASGVAWRQAYQIGKTLTAIPYAWSIYAKAKELNWLVINAFDGSNRATYFNLANGTVGTVAAGDSASIQNVGNGWYRCIVTRTAAATVNGGLSIELTTGDNIAPTTANLTAGQGIFFYGAQLEAGAFATSYIPTVASTVTRSADVATITGQNFAQWYRQPEGTLVAEFSGPSGGYPLNMTDGTTNNATGIVYVGATTLRGISVVSGAGRFVDMAASAAPAVNKTSYGYRLNDLGGSTNNGAVVANTTAPIPVLDRMFVGTFSNFSFLNGHIRNIRFIPARAADFQLQALST